MTGYSRCSFPHVESAEQGLGQPTGSATDPRQQGKELGLGSGASDLEAPHPLFGPSVHRRSPSSAAWDVETFSGSEKAQVTRELN